MVRRIRLTASSKSGAARFFTNRLAQFAYCDEQIDHIGGAATHNLVALVGIVAQFSHVAQDRYTAAIVLRLNIVEQVERSNHAGRTGVIGVIE
jgi:hypothetical protein